VKRALDAGARCVSALGIAGMLCLGAVPEAGAGTSTLTNPSVVFANPGTKQVSMTVCNGTACNSVTKNVVVLDPHPVVTGATVSVTTAEVGQLIRLAGTGTGKPPLTFSWSVTPVVAPAAPASALLGASLWWDTTGLSPGIYTIGLGLSNASGTASSLPMTVSLAAAAATDFYTIPPCRVYDSRSGAALASGSSTMISVVSAACGIPSDARAVAGNLTVVNPSNLGYISLYPGNYPQPTTSTANFTGGIVRGNSVIMGLATDGSGKLGLGLFVTSGGTAHVVLDVTGYFTVPPVVGL
jgi:hypothetical protein